MIRFGTERTGKSLAGGVRFEELAQSRPGLLEVDTISVHMVQEPFIRFGKVLLALEHLTDLAGRRLLANDLAAFEDVVGGRLLHIHVLPWLARPNGCEYMPVVRRAFAQGTFLTNT